MLKFSPASHAQLITCHLDWHKIFYNVLHEKKFDCTILEGYRSNERQEEMYRKGLSKKRAGQSKHNTNPSLAIDVAPYPIDWNDTKRFYYLGGLVKATAQELGIEIIWGGDWDNDNDFNDQTFMDLVHFQKV